MNNETFELDIKPAERVDNPNRKLKIIGSNTFEYEIYKLIDEYDPILRTRAPEYDFDKPIVKSNYLAFSMIETMRKKRGIGLAAPQCNISTRMLVCGGDERSGVGYAMFNPILIGDYGIVKMDEGCLSFPGLYLPIKRAEKVTVAWKDLEGKDQENEFSGLTARVIQHEMDHLDGVLYTTLVSPITLDQRKRKVKKNLKILRERFEKEDKEEIIAQAMKNLYAEGLKKKQHPEDVAEAKANAMISIDVG